MKTPLALGLGFLPGLLAGFFFATSSTDKKPETISKVTESTRRISTRQSSTRTKHEEKGETLTANFFLSDWRDTYHTLHMAELVEQISRLSADDFPASLDRAGSDSRIEVMLYQKWSDLNPRAALTHLLEETDYDSLDCLEDDLPDVALLSGEKLLAKEGRVALPTIRKLMERVDVNGIGYNYGDNAGYQNLFATWAATDFDDALNFYMIECEGYWYDGSGLGLAEGAAAAGKSRDLMTWIAAHPDIFLTTGLVKTTMSEWAKRDLQAALTWVTSNEVPKDEGALEGVTQTWIKKDTDAFLGWAASEGPTGLAAARDHALHDPQKTTAWLLENEDGSPAWNSIRTALLTPLDYYRSATETDLERYFLLISTGDPATNLRHDHLGKLFLRYTQNPTNYDPEDERPFRLHKTGPVSELAQKYGYQNEFEKFREHQRQSTIKANLIEAEMQLLSNSRQKLHHESGLEEDE